MISSKSSLFHRLLVAGVTLLLVNGCAEIDRRVKQWDPEGYTVQSGDTLFSIAWRYEIDYRELALWNNIDQPDAIYPGQRLRTRKPEPVPIQTGVKNTAQVKTVAPSGLIVARGDTLYSLSRRTGHSIDQLAKWNQLTVPYTLHQGQNLYLGPHKPVSDKIRSTATKTTSKRIRSWLWPVKGKLLSRYGSGKKNASGIDIAGKTGAGVVSSASGRVVYSGNGLISYGNLLIIKHNNTFLSAYAHNSELLVKEGEKVNAGQVIAKLGKTGTKVPKLHFEIRKNGKPVNPLDYLPIQ